MEIRRVIDYHLTPVGNKGLEIVRQITGLTASGISIHAEKQCRYGKPSKEVPWGYYHKMHFIIVQVASATTKVVTSRADFLDPTVKRVW